MTTEQFVATLVASSLGAFVAAWLSFRYALPRLRSERAFDRRLEWYERAIRQLVNTANALSWSFAADEAEFSPANQEEALKEAYRAVTMLRALEFEAELYATNSAYDALREAIVDVTAVAYGAMMSRKAKTMPPPAKLLQIAYKILFHTVSRLAADVRDHLNLEPIGREWRIYDQELRDLREELARLEKATEEGSDPQQDTNVDSDG